MTERRKLTAESLGGLGLPRSLVEEFLKIDALGLDRPLPTEELVQTTLARCEKALEAFEPTEEPSPVFSELFRTSFSWPRGTLSDFAQFMGALNASVVAQAVPFAREKHHESAVLLIDNHSVIEPERWASDPSFMMLGHVYRGVDDALEKVSGKPIDRVIILKADVSTYDEKDLTVIRKAIEEPTTKDTYLVAAKDAGPFKGFGCAVVARQIIFEMRKGKGPDSIVLRDPGGVRDQKRAAMVCREVSELKKKGMAVYEGDILNAKLKTALRSKHNAKLLSVLKSVGTH